MYITGLTGPLLERPGSVRDRTRRHAAPDGRPARSGCRRAVPAQTGGRAWSVAPRRPSNVPRNTPTGRSGPRSRATVGWEPPGGWWGRLGTTGPHRPYEGLRHADLRDPAKILTEGPSQLFEGLRPRASSHRRHVAASQSHRLIGVCHARTPDCDAPSDPSRTGGRRGRPQGAASRQMWAMSRWPVGLARCAWVGRVRVGGPIVGLPNRRDGVQRRDR
jgi:hypothetical protein